MAQGYQEDLAYIHDVGFGDYARNVAPGLLGLLRRGGVAGGLVVDLGCGSGLWAEALVGAGYEVRGVDLSPAMIKMARRRVPQARFEVGSLLDAPLPACDAVTSLGECVNFWFDPQNSPEALARLFARVHAALRPGGMFAFDVAEPGRAGRAWPRVANRAGDDWAVLVLANEDPEERLLTRRITSFRRVGKLYRRSEEVHRLRLYKATDLAEGLRRAGFRARVLSGYGAYRLPGPRAALVARKV